MIHHDCSTAHRLMQQELDSGLDAAAIATLAGHLAICPACMARRRRIGGPARSRLDFSPEQAPALMRAFLMAQIVPKPRFWRRPAVLFACLMLIATAIFLLRHGQTAG